MLAWMDDEALHRTLTTGRCTYWSRSRTEYWVKGRPPVTCSWSSQSRWTVMVMPCSSRSTRWARRATRGTGPASKWGTLTRSPVSARRLGDTMPPPAPNLARRELSVALAVGAAGAGMVLLAAQQPWARASFAPAPPPLPTSSITVTGHALLPAANALGLAALACLAAVIATRGVVRRVVGMLLALLGLLIAVPATMSVRPAHVAAAAAARRWRRPVRRA